MIKYGSARRDHAVWCYEMAKRVATERTRYTGGELPVQGTIPAHSVVETMAEALWAWTVLDGLTVAAVALRVKAITEALYNTTTRERLLSPPTYPTNQAIVAEAGLILTFLKSKDNA